MPAIPPSPGPALADGYPAPTGRALSALLVLVVLLAFPAAFVASPAQAQNPVRQVVDDLTGTGSDSGQDSQQDSQQDSGEAPEEEGAEETAGIFPGAPPEPTLLQEDLLRPATWKRLAEQMLSALVGWLPSLLAAGLILTAFFFFNRLASGMLSRVITRTGAEPAAREIALRLTKYAILIIGLVMAASQLGIQVGSLLAGLGIVGLAIGLAAQDTLANLVAGITILWDRPFRIGDNVTVTGTFGRVQEIGLRTTRIRTVEQLDTILPNKEIINAIIVNHTLNPMMRLGIPVGIAYAEDSREAREVLLGAVKGHQLILDEPAPTVVVIALGASSVDLELRVWLRDPYTEREATCVMTELAKIALDEAGIEIPFPQRTLHFAQPFDLRSEDRDDGPGAPADPSGQGGE